MEQRYLDPTPYGQQRRVHRQRVATYLVILGIFNVLLVVGVILAVAR